MPSRAREERDHRVVARRNGAWPHTDEDRAAPIASCRISCHGWSGAPREDRRRRASNEALRRCVTPRRTAARAALERYVARDEIARTDSVLWRPTVGVPR